MYELRYNKIVNLLIYTNLFAFHNQLLTRD